MDGSWTADGELSHGGADNTPGQALANTNELYIQYGKVITEGSCGGRWDGDVPNKGPVSRIQEIGSEVASSTSTHNASRDFSPDCQEVPSGTTCPSMGSLLNIPEDSIERKESVMSNMYNSVTDHFPAAIQQQTDAQYLDPLFDGSSLNDKVPIETSCKIIKRCSSLGFYDSTERKDPTLVHFAPKPLLVKKACMFTDVIFIDRHESSGVTFVPEALVI
ncbi:hypothetical protein KOW79_010588 [Hemibagrus wyckioides]|uniref:Uncharacterized protein n=1 Tax=Hemibagrus wyckioides TaxID=337641 RepID=A0A9D3NQV0_9TELE|nr:hypothetical protein KOW79_010588 [Hemibagrus wyckioides]